ncbi:uncharacterized protein LOC142324466 [Lycorma delicatula]|uniref:uncharacterized protein LOC142324466 n=1 Tax=Lycorma delicatula TaxID=130591 RepID=UPI003F515D98
MRIQEIKANTTCAKMTEEKSMNGDISSGIKKEFVSSESTNGPSSPNLTGESESSSSVGGGRLKFFKDGKFILELSHRKDGDRGGCWVPVPKKTTFWPAVGTPRHESSASLSVSDDNSSVQSSPWQRDHCWKQSTPRHHAGRGLEFYMVRPSKLRRLQYSCVLRRKRRRPLDSRLVNLGDCKEINNVTKPKEKTSLAKVITVLWERVVRTDPGIVSPRKRILREMERVTLEDQAKRRARTAASEAKPPSHSITSILAREDEPSFLRTLLRSPDPPSPSRPTTVPFLTPPIHAMYSPHPSSSFLPHPSHTNYYSPIPSHWYPVSSLPRGSIYPGPLLPPYALTASPWPHISPHSLSDFKRDDGSSDVPLNLSKHAG